MNSPAEPPGPKHRPMMDVLEDYRSLAWLLDGLFREMEEDIRPGVKTSRFDAVAAAFIKNEGLQSSFKGYRGFPAHVTASINHEVLNTLPSGRTLQDGDLFKLQCGIQDGVGHSYQSWTYVVGRVRREDEKFLAAGKLALERAVEQVKPGAPVVAISRAIESTLVSAGYSPNEKFVGHGMGRKQHEAPQVPCIVDPKAPPELLRKGQILSIQVIAHQGGHACRVTSDTWGVVTVDGSRALIFSQIVVATEKGPEIITPPRR
jgi:methionyl aminopeptidase